MHMATPNSEFCISEFFDSDTTNSNPNMSDFLKKASKLFSGSSGKKKERQKADGKGREEKKGENRKGNDGKEEEGKAVVNVNEDNNEKWGKKLKNRGKLFVGRLNPGTTDQNLEIYFSRFGKVVDSVVVKCPKTSKSRGFGFVTFADPACAEMALKGNHTLDGKVIETRPFGKKKGENRVFLGGLPETVQEKNLKDFFMRYGEVTSVDIITDRITKKPKGFAFLEFKDAESMEKCLSESFVHMKGKRVSLKKAEARDESMTNDDASVPDWSQEEEEDFDVETRSSSSGGQWSIFDQDPRFQKLFEDYFLAKPKSGDAVNDTTEKEWNESAQPQEKEVEDLEKLLMDVFLNPVGGKNVEDDEENLIDFSTDEETSEEDTRDYDSSSDELDDIIDGNSNCCMRIGGGDGDLTLKSPNSFLAKGSLWCSLCQWRPPDGSSESFFAHCQTPAHRLKTQERFDLGQNQVNTRDVKTVSTTATIRSKSLEKLLIGESDLEEEEKRRTKQKKNPNQPQKNQQKQSQQQLPQKRPQQDHKQQKEQQKPVQVTKQERDQKIQRRRAKQKQQNQQQQQQNQQQQQQKLPQHQHQKQQQNQTRKNVQQQNKKRENKEEVKTKQDRVNISDLKIHALAKGMVSIRPLSGNKLHCTMCRKTIPQAQDFGTLMKNLSQHLQSKQHLNNLSQTENSLMNALEENPKQGKGSSSINNNNNIPAATTKGSAGKVKMEKTSGESSVGRKRK